MPGSRKPDRRNAVHPKKLLLSKWTAVTPQHREKHFLVTEVEEPDVPGGAVIWLHLEAILTRRSYRLPWRELGDASHWVPGWK
ncbi:TIGR02450 family Trp-rich protein [Chitinimonas naiadis]